VRAHAPVAEVVADGEFGWEAAKQVRARGMGRYFRIWLWLAGAGRSAGGGGARVRTGVAVPADAERRGLPVVLGLGHIAHNTPAVWGRRGKFWLASVSRRGSA